MRSYQFNVGFDVDDVFAHTYPALHAVCVREGFAPALPLPVTWSPFEEYGVDREVWVEAMNRAARDGFLYRDLEPDIEALQGVRELYWEGHMIHMVTARGFLGEPEIIAEHTQGWFFEYGVPNQSLTYSRTKSLVCRQRGIDFFLDDNADNWRDIAMNSETVSYLLDRPWNQHVDAGDFRVYSVQQYVDIIKEVAAND